MNDFLICRPDTCTGCGACVQACPKNCIKMFADEQGFLHPKISYDKCVRCRKCEVICPSNAELKGEKESEFYMAVHRDADVLAKSSSGGAFSALADIILSRGGVVFGATVEPVSREIKHIMIENADELDKLRLSKYYQSNTENTYINAKKMLEAGREVLFCGTACQIAGLYQICGHHEKLITADILCHGVTSKTVVDAYIRSQEKKFKKNISAYRFRVKEGSEGWKNGGGD